MKTKDFIKMLQEADPEGEGYIRFPEGGAPWFAEVKEGYWDGPYQYLEKGDKHRDLTVVTSTEGYKVDLHAFNIDDIVWEERGDMNKIRKRIKLQTTYLNQEHHSKPFWKNIEKEAEYARKRDENFLKEWYGQVLEEYYEDGWEIRQPLDKPIGYYNCMTAHKLLCVPKNLNQGSCDILIRSGNFYPEKKKKYYVWKHNPEKGKNWSLK
jgi:Zn-finger nucleic acid-binding protein